MLIIELFYFSDYSSGRHLVPYVCPHCEGTGYDPLDYDVDWARSCPVCDGDGLLLVPEYVHTDALVPLEEDQRNLRVQIAVRDRYGSFPPPSVADWWQPRP